MRRRSLLLLAGTALLVAVTLMLLDAGPPPQTWREIDGFDALSVSALGVAVFCGRRARLAAAHCSVRA